MTVIADLLSRWQDSIGNTEKLHSLVPDYQWVKVKDEFFQLDWEI